jgi:dihydroflavonol-4-reductase
MDATLVTGGTGLVGFHIVNALVRRGRPVRALVRSLERARRLLPAECDLIEGDVTDRPSVKRALQGCSVLYHAAGLPEQWQADPSTFQRVNVGGTKNMVEAAFEQGIRRFMHSSTADVFYADPGAEFDESTLDPHPKPTIYERSKQQADRLVADSIGRGLPAIFLHPAAVYGPGPSSSPGIGQIILMLQRGRIPALPPGGVSLVFAPDVGEGHVLAEERAKPGSRYILSDTYCEIVELARIALQEAGMKQRLPPVAPEAVARLISGLGEVLARWTHRPPLLPHGGLEFMLSRRHASGDKARRELGWTTTPLRVGMQRTIQYLAEQPPASLQ